MQTAWPCRLLSACILSQIIFASAQQKIEASGYEKLSVEGVLTAAFEHAGLTMGEPRGYEPFARRFSHMGDAMMPRETLYRRDMRENHATKTMFSPVFARQDWERRDSRGVLDMAGHGSHELGSIPQGYFNHDGIRDYDFSLHDAHNPHALKFPSADIEAPHLGGSHQAQRNFMGHPSFLGDRDKATMPFYMHGNDFMWHEHPVSNRDTRFRESYTYGAYSEGFEPPRAPQSTGHPDEGGTRMMPHHSDSISETYNSHFLRGGYSDYEIFEQARTQQQEFDQPQSGARRLDSESYMQGARSDYELRASHFGSRSESEKFELRRLRAQHIGSHSESEEFERRRMQVPLQGFGSHENGTSNEDGEISTRQDQVCVLVCMYVCVCVCVYTCMCKISTRQDQVCAFVCACVYVHVCVCCAYIHIYIYI
jgi:hypothetical protein